MPSKTKDAEAALHDQTQLLPQRQLILVFCIMSTALLVCFIDQNGIGVLQPDIARDLHAADSISWAGTSALIANTVFQVLYGRLSDLFGRKKVILSALVLLSLSDLACGLSVNSTMLYIFRGLAGVANGGITSLSMMIVSDIVTLQQRGKYQGILGSMVGLGNALGPLIGALFARYATWRGLFYLLAPLIMVAVAASWVYLPSNMPKGNLRETVAKIDFIGLFFGSAAVIFLLIPISSGGHAGMPWDSAEVIAMLVVGALCLVAFILTEWKVARLPLMPLDIFRKASVAAMLVQSFLIGAVYYSNAYFIPLYFQNVRGKSTLTSALLLLPMVGTQSTCSVLSGFAMSYLNRYAFIIWSGFAFWTLGAGLLTMAGEDTPIGVLIVFLIITGAGLGQTFQTTLVALQAHCPKEQRAVIVSNRNFLRSSGGAVGLAISSAVLSNVLKSSLPENLQSIAASTFAAPSLSGYSLADQATIKSAYASASRAVFIWCVPACGINLLLCLLIKDHGLQRKEEREAQAAAASATTAAESAQTPQVNEEDPERGPENAPQTVDEKDKHESFVLTSTTPAEREDYASRRSSSGSEKSRQSHKQDDIEEQKTQHSRSV